MAWGGGGGHGVSKIDGGETHTSRSRLTEKDLHVFRLGCVVLTPHDLEVQRRRAQTGYVAGGKIRIDGLGGVDAVQARLGGDGDGDGVVVEMGGDGVPDGLVEAVVVAKVQVVATEAAVELAEDWRENRRVRRTTRLWYDEQGWKKIRINSRA